MPPQESNVDTLAAKNKEMKLELHKSRKNNGILRSRIAKKDREVNDLRDKKLDLINTIDKMEKSQQRDREYISSQEKEIEYLRKQLKKKSSADPEKEDLKKSLEEVVSIKLKYENIIQALIQNPEVKPIIANLFN